MQHITIALNDEMFAELKSASEAALEMGFTPERFASECVESVLASRRLPRVCWRQNEKSIQSRE